MAMIFFDDDISDFSKETAIQLIRASCPHINTSIYICTYYAHTGYMYIYRTYLEI